MTVNTLRSCLGKADIVHLVSLDGKCIFISSLVIKLLNFCFHSISDEGLMLEMSALRLFTVANLHF